MAGHVHAELIIAYGEDARTHERPWELWQYKDHVDGNWHDFNRLNPPNWFEDIEYRRKPKTISINGFDVSEAINFELKEGDNYFTPRITGNELFFEFEWDNDRADIARLKNGVIHLTKEAAIQHAKALLSFTERRG